MEQEAAFLTALQSTASYEIKVDRLLLLDAGGAATLTLFVLEPTPLMRTSWLLQAYNNGKGGFTTVLLGCEITVVFDGEGSLSGSAGCNT
jgi:heat shock protein HslJ